MAYTTAQELSDLVGHPVQLLLRGNTAPTTNQQKLRVAIRHLKPDEKVIEGYTGAGICTTNDQIYVGIVRAVIPQQEFFEEGGLIVANTRRPHNNPQLHEGLVYFDLSCIAGYNKLTTAPKEYRLLAHPQD